MHLRLHIANADHPNTFKKCDTFANALHFQIRCIPASILYSLPQRIKYSDRKNMFKQTFAIFELSPVKKDLLPLQGLECVIFTYLQNLLD